MASEIPEKDIQVAVRLLEKLATARTEQSVAKNEFDTLSDEHEEYRRSIDARTNYLDVLSEVAEAVGEEIEPDNDDAFEELTKKLEESKVKLESLDKKAARLRELAEKLKDQAPGLWDGALEAYGKPFDLDEDTEYIRPKAHSSRNRYEQEEETNVEVVDQILNWKSDQAEPVPPLVIEDGFDRSAFFNLDLLESPRLQHRSDQKPLIVLDALDIFKKVTRYDTESAGGIDNAHIRFLSDLDFLSGHWELPLTPVFDAPFELDRPLAHEVIIKSANVKPSDKAAVNRQIMRIVEEELVGKKSVALVTDDLSLSRDAALIGAIIIDIDELYRGV